MGSILVKPKIPSARRLRPQLLRVLVLLCILLTFGKLTWQLPVKPLWWDESLTLQRAEEAWPDLLRGEIVIWDGVNQMPTRDQHPFLFFVLTGVLVRLGGESEFTLRFVSVMAGTLIIPGIWVTGRHLQSRRLVPQGTAEWAVLLAAVNPFFLWYGQEARPYILWAWLALISSYLLLRWAENTAQDNLPVGHILRGIGPYLLTLVLFLSTHYFSVLLFLVQSVVIFTALAPRNRRMALAVTAGAGGLVLAAAAIAGWLLLSQPGAGSNFRSISLYTLSRDLLNALSLGLSVNIEHVWWLDLLFGVLALLGAGWGLRTYAVIRRGGWFLPAFVLGPIFLLFGVNLAQPVYMNSRHLALIGAGYVLLVGAGLGFLMQFPRARRLLLGPITLLLVGGSIYSTYNYFTVPAYSKGPDLRRVGSHLAQRLQPADLVLLNPSFAWRLFAYYLPRHLMESHPEGDATGWRGVPLVAGGWEETFQALEDWRNRYRRIWLITETTHPYPDPERKVENWLQEEGFRIWERSYFSPNAELDVALFLPTPPITDALPDTVTLRPDALFGQQIALRGLQLHPRLRPDGPMPVTLYWDPVVPIEQRYKYKLWLVTTDAQGETEVYQPTEKEPYDGFLPTVWWRPGPLIFEYTQVEAPPTPSPDITYAVHLLLYHADTLEPLPLSAADGSGPTEDQTELRIVLP